MSISDHGFSTEQPDTTAVLSYWHVPNGADYHQASVRYRYFSSYVEAQQVQDKYDYPPCMPIVTTLQVHKEIQAKVEAELEHREGRSPT